MRESDSQTCPLRRRALEDPEAVLAERGDEVLRALEADRLASGVEAFCRREGVDAGSRVALEAPPGPGWIPFLFGAFRAGAVVCPLHLRLPDAARTEAVDRVGAGLRIAEFPRVRALEGPGRVNAQGPATVVFTSGSMGAPRGIVHSLGQHLASARAAVESGGMAVGEWSLVSLPLYHVGGLAVLFRAVISGGGLVFPVPGESLGGVLARRGADFVSLVPTQLRGLMAAEEGLAALRSVKRILLGGAAAPAGLLRRAVERGVGVSASYGMTETASQVAAVPPGWRGPEAWSTSGRVLPHAELRVAGDGELWVRGESVCLGEWRGEGVRPLTDEGGWLPTGDRGRVEGGWLRVEGRCDRMFVSGGENIQPEMIEGAFREVAGLEAVVVPVEDAVFGQRPAAWVNGPVDGASTEAWNAGLRRRLPGYMVPVAYRCLPEGMTTGLKPDLQALERMAARMLNP